jgi:peptidyl-prolyl cis-trans isomerase A (cyclophilin A)
LEGQPTSVLQASQPFRYDAILREAGLVGGEMSEQNGGSRVGATHRAVVVVRSVVLVLVVLLTIAACGDGESQSGPTGTVVRFDTVLGTFDVELLDDVAPITVENFLGYVTSGEYDGSIIHRAVPDFVIQGGGFTTGPVITFPETFPGRVPNNGFIRNEFQASNLRGTIAMALEEVAGRPLINSASNEWYFNLVDNTRLDPEKFTVFGRVLGSGMGVVDAIGALPTYDLTEYNDALTNVPLRSPPDPELEIDELVVIRRITIVESPRL